MRLSWRPGAAALAVPVVLLLGGCDRGANPTDPATSGTTLGGSALAFSQDVGVGTVQTTLATGPARIVVWLASDSLVATRLTVERPRQMRHSEKVSGTVTAVAEGGLSDTLVLDVGGLRVVLDSATRVNGEGDDEHEEEMEDSGMTSLAAFVSQLKSDVAAGKNPVVEVTRRPPTAPQSPTDGSFTAGTVRRNDGDDAPFIEMNVDSANFQLVSAPPTDAWLKVLGVAIAIRSSTTIKSDLQPAEDANRFAGAVAKVDSTADTLTLGGGMKLKIVAGTEIEHDGSAQLATLGDVARAVAAGKTVMAVGRAVLDTASPAVWDVISVRFITLGAGAGRGEGGGFGEGGH